MSESSQQHLQAAAESLKSRPISCAVLTVSDTRTLQTDTGGSLIISHLEKAGHRVSQREIVKDEPHQIGVCLTNWLNLPDIHAILTTGGTGIARRDTTIEVVRSLITTELEGFCELFRMISYSQVQAAAMLSRAVAGLVVRPPQLGCDTFIFSMPGSTNAVETAMSNLIIPQLPHLVWERTR
ncbi:MAG TPA: MogA/MoaB family molybdenum cofactor biosynthesis protein [Phycisphaerales bacterium]|nr:MogA/MoaB family molybdenum cofactor biosynthesis protein [Phycisphaerales bacterium]